MTLPASRWRAFKIFWYERIRPGWLELRPVVLALATVAVFVLGTIGFQQYMRAHDQHGQVIDSFYRTLTLFELDGYDVEPPIPWAMEVARFLAPILVGYAVFRGVVTVFRTQVQLVGIRFLTRGHVVVAGLGEMGFRLASAFRAQGFRVVAIDVDEANELLQSARERGITVLAGDARDQRMLAKARTDFARYLVAACGEDGRNVEVAVSAAKLAARRTAGVLHVLVHLEQPGLWRMLKAEAISRLGAEALRMEFFNAFETGARILLDERPPFPAVAEPAAPRRPHVLVAGLDGIGDSLILNVARLWQRSQPAEGEHLRLTILEEDAEAARLRLLARYPELERICDLRAASAPLGVELQRGSLNVDVGDGHAVTAVYICVEQEAQALEAALALRARPELQGVPFALAVNEAGVGLATILHDDPETAHGVYGFGVLERALQVGPLLRGTNEALARAKHEEYVRHQLDRGVPLGEGLMVPWEQLDEQWKDANRAFADGIGGQLAAAGCILVPAPLIDPHGQLLSFTAEEVEGLARSEHDRWVADKVRNGWRFGPVRDDARKIHPLLVAWGQLDEVERDKDREPVREVPQMLAYAGFEIVRLTEADAPGPSGDDGGDGASADDAQSASPRSNAPLTPASSAFNRYSASASAD
ncbi:MAG: RyR domain-containing protein [Solirubrobacteraceae bacterium]